MVDQLVENDQLVDHLRGALRDGRSGLEYVPKLLRRVLEERAWERRIDRVTGAEVGFASFSEFIRTAPSEGLGADIDLVRRVVGDDPVAVDLLDQATQNPTGLHNIQTKAPTGTSESAALRRLRKDRPDLHERVLARELSAHAAMLEAGFRPRTQTVRIDDPDAVARTLRKHMSPEALARLKELLWRG